MVNYIVKKQANLKIAVRNAKKYCFIDVLFLFFCCSFAVLLSLWWPAVEWAGEWAGMQLEWAVGWIKHLAETQTVGRCRSKQKRGVAWSGDQKRRREENEPTGQSASQSASQPVGQQKRRLSISFVAESRHAFQVALNPINLYCSLLIQYKIVNNEYKMSFT